MTITTLVGLCCAKCQTVFQVDLVVVADVGEKPALKQQLLYGNWNLAVCPNCGYTESTILPFLYHDPIRRVVLWYRPPVTEGTALERMSADVEHELVKLQRQHQYKYLEKPAIFDDFMHLVGVIMRLDSGSDLEHAVRESRFMHVITLLKMARNNAEIDAVLNQYDDSITAEFLHIIELAVDATRQTGDTREETALRRVQEIVAAHLRHRLGL